MALTIRYSKRLPMKNNSTLLATGLLLLLGGCALGPAENREMAHARQDVQIRLGELVAQTRSAAQALETIFGSLGLAERSGMQFDSVTLSMEVAHTRGEDGHLAALLSADDDERQKADDKVVMTLHPQPSNGGHELADAYREYQPCGLGGALQSDSTDVGRLDVALVQAGMAALDAYLCARSQSGDATLTLDSLTVTLSVDVLRTDSGGLVLRLGNLSLGGEETQSSESVATATLEFTSSASD